MSYSVKEFIAERKRIYYKTNNKKVRSFYWKLKRDFYKRKFYEEQKKYL